MLHAKNPITTSSTPSSLAKAFRAVEQEIAAVPDGSLIRINLDISSAAQIGLGVIDRIQGLLPELAELPEYDLPRVRALGTYAGALLFAHLRVQEPEREIPRLFSLLQEAVPLRMCLLSGADALVPVGLAAADRVAAIRSGRGHADTANDLSALATLFEESWDRIKGKTAITRSMVRRAAALGPRLHAELGLRRMQPIEPVGDRRRVRARAFTLFVQVYDLCRRGVTYLRWLDGDIEQFVPSLYPKRRPRSVTPVESIREADVVPPLGGFGPSTTTLAESHSTLILAETSI